MNRKLRAVYASLAEAAARAPLAAAHPKGERKGLRVTAVSSDMTEMHVYGEIGGGWLFGGINAADFMAELSDISTPNLHVRISSPGGDVFEAVAMHTALRNWGGTVTTFNDAIAASAASFLAMAGDRIVTEQGAMWMVHAASTGTMGNAKDHRDSAELLDKVSANIAEFYALRAGGTAEEWMDLLNSGDTWYTAQEALDVGLTDEIVSSAAPADVNAKLRYAIKNYKIANAPDIPEVVFQPPADAEPDDAADETADDDAPDLAEDETLLADADFAFAMSMTHFLIERN